MPGAAERVLMRRRLRRQRRLRETLLLDLGALVYELHRQGRRAPELLQEKAGELSAVDEEVRGLEEALGDGRGLAPLLAAGIVGSCASCGALLNAGDDFCARCGAAARVGAEDTAGWAAAPDEDELYEGDDERYEDDEEELLEDDEEELLEDGDEEPLEDGDEEPLEDEDEEPLEDDDEPTAPADEEPRP